MVVSFLIALVKFRHKSRKKTSLEMKQALLDNSSGGPEEPQDTATSYNADLDLDFPSRVTSLQSEILVNKPESPDALEPADLLPLEPAWEDARGTDDNKYDPSKLHANSDPGEFQQSLRAEAVISVRKPSSYPKYGSPTLDPVFEPASVQRKSQRRKMQSSKTRFYDEWGAKEGFQLLKTGVTGSV